MQNRRAIVFLGLAVVFGIAAAFVAQRYLTSQQGPEAARTPEAVSVVVARLDLPVATTLEDRQLKTLPWPKEYVPAGALTSTSQARGRVLRRPVVAGEPVLNSALFEEGMTGGLGAVISPKLRALSVKVDAVIGVAGFVMPGARVDVLATLRRIDLSKPLPYTKVILQDVRVLAIDQKLEQARDGEPELVSVVTMEVDPDQAQKLTYAAHEGRLQLAMRSPGDTELVKSRMVGVAMLLDGAKPVKTGQKPVIRVRRTVQVIRGLESEVKKF